MKTLFDSFVKLNYLRHKPRDFLTLSINASKERQVLEIERVFNDEIGAWIASVSGKQEHYKDDARVLVSSRYFPSTEPLLVISQYVLERGRKITYLPSSYVLVIRDLPIAEFDVWGEVEDEEMRYMIMLKKVNKGSFYFVKYEEFNVF